MAKILLVEDEVALREVLADELTAQGHQITEAANGQEGLERLLAATPDIILCDRAMAGMSGFDLLEKIRSSYPQYNNIPFVFLTALGDARDKAAVEHLNPAGYIEKPVDFDVLQETLNGLLKAA